MKIKDLAEEIKKQMPPNLTELEVLRYIYIYLGKNVSFSPQYYFGNSKTRQKIYNLAKSKMYDEEFLTENKELVCTSIASKLRLVTKQFGIDLSLQKDEENTPSHMHNTARLEDGRLILLDLQRDLQYIHTDRKTRFFGSIDYICDCIGYEELEKIDEKIGYKEVNKDYKDKEIELLQKATKGMGTLHAVKFILNSDSFNETLKASNGYVETYEYIKAILNMCVEKHSAYVINCYRDKDINGEQLPKRQNSMCIYAENGKNFSINLFKKKEEKFVNVSVNQMAKLTKQGLNVFQNSEGYGKLMRKIKDNILGKDEY